MLKRLYFFKWSLLLALMLSMVVLLAGCPRAFQGKEAALPPGIAVGDTYYTQFSLMFEKNRHRTTNYRRGFLLPINAKVQLVSFGRKGFVIKVLPSGPEIEIENVQKHTGDTPEQAFHKILAKTPVNMKKFTPMERKNILAGKVIRGMRKEAVIAAIGYPPVTGTPSLDRDEWRYWASRFDTFIIRFKNGRVAAVIN